MKTYCFFLICLITVTHIYVALGAPVENNNPNYKNINPGYKLCRTDECINVASEILAKLNRTVDPCDNFYKFACGGWVHNHPVDESSPYVNVFAERDRKTKSQLRELLEEPVKEDDTPSFRKAKHIFAQCMDTKSNTYTAVGNEAAIWNEYIEWLWNMTSDTWEEFTEKFTEWQSFSDELHEHGFDNGLFTIRVTKDFLRNNSKNIIIIEAPSSLSLFNKRSQYTTSFSLTKIYDPVYPESRLNLDDYTRTALDIKYFQLELFDLKTAARQLDKKIYIRYQTIQNWQEKYDAQYKRETNVKLMYYAKESEAGSFVDDVAWKICVNKINLNSAISHEYVKKYASHLNVDAMREIGSDVKDAFGDQIKQSTWMDEPTKYLSLEKLASLKQEFIKPDWYSDEAIDKYYESVNVSMGYFTNILSIYMFERNMMLRSLRTPIDKTKWASEPYTMEAYFSQQFNKIVIPAVFLQTPIYYNSRLPSINYGTLGFIIAHEIIHGFDDDGYMFDKDGYIVKWWTQRSIDAFGNLTQCFVDQYDKYLLPGFEDSNTYVNGRFTLSENICDSAGIASAYYAYKKKKAQLNETEWRLEGLEDYSDDQIFFMTYAQTWCSNYHPTDLDYILLDDHPVAEIRIRGSLSNSREFSKVYNCPVGKPMNPQNKCTLWQWTDEKRKNV